MRLRWIANAAAMVMAVLVAIAMPVSQLRTVETVSEKCCCPDPTHCHCPPQSKAPSKAPQLKNCHRISHDVVSPVAPAFTPTTIAIALPEARVIELPQIEPAAPHAAPASRRPDAPS